VAGAFGEANNAKYETPYTSPTPGFSKKTNERVPEIYIYMSDT
jgi:hypothetical protein